MVSWICSVGELPNTGAGAIQHANIKPTMSGLNAFSITASLGHTLTAQS
jgi:hypothetical protein